LAGKPVQAQTATVTVTPSSLAFGTPALSAQSAPQVVTISVTGSGTATLGSLSIGGTNDGDFAATTNCALELTAPASCRVNVMFTASAAGLRSATLSFTGQEFAVALTGAAGAIKLFDPVDVAPSLPGTGLFTPSTFGTTSLYLSCPSGFSAKVSSTPDGTGNVLVDNDLVVATSFAPTPVDVCPSEGSCFNTAYSTPADEGELNGQDPDNLTATGGVPPLNITSELTSGSPVQTTFDLLDFGGVYASSTLFLVTSCTQDGVQPGGTVSGNLVDQSDLASLVQTFTFDSTSGQAIQFGFDFTAGAGQSGTTFPSTSQGPRVTDVAIDPTKFSAMVAGTSAAPSTCMRVAGEYPMGTLCKAFLFQCPDANGNYAGTNCPQSSVRSLLFEAQFDTPDLPTPVGNFAFAPGTGPGFLMGTDTWPTTIPLTTCTFGSAPASLYGQLCPQNPLTAFYDARPSSPTSPNSTFIPVLNMPLPSTVTTVTSANPNGWSNTTSASVHFVASPATYSCSPSPACLNGFTPALIQSVTYGWTPASSPVPDSTFPVPGDTTLYNSGSCPTTTPGSFTPTPNASFTLPTEGIYNLHYFATDCATTEELVFTPNNSPTVNWASFKTVPIGVDKTPPMVTCTPPTPPSGSDGWFDTNVSVPCTATDQDYVLGSSGSGFLPLVMANGIQGSQTETFFLTTNVGPLSESSAAPATTSQTIADLAGNTVAPPALTFMVDLQPPVITGPILSPSASGNTYSVGQPGVAVNYSCSDGLGSGVASCVGTFTSGSTSGTLASGGTIDTSAAALGSHTFTVSASDVAGNIATTQSVTYQVVVGNTAAFVNTDKTTQGNWMSLYGADGYDIANGPQYPTGGSLISGGKTYGSYAVNGQSNYTWASPTSAPQALEIDSEGDRIAATWYSGTSFTFDVNLTDGQQHQMSLYLLDFDSKGRAETVQIKDHSSGAVLDTRVVPDSSGDADNTYTTGANFVNGSYLIWNVAGHVTITITSNAGPNCVVAGIFFGGPDVPVPPVSTTASFSGADTSTEGSWLGTYGADGYWVANGGQSMPQYDPTLAMNGESTWTWASPTSDPRAPETGTDGATSRTASTWYSSSSFTFDVNITDGQTHQVALYLLNWDSQGRTETVQISDATSNKVLDTRVIPNATTGSPTYTNTTVANFVNGSYLIWKLSGHVTITITSNAGPNAVVAGIFFGGNSVAPPVTPPAVGAASWVKSDTGTQGTWMGKYGSNGYSLANAGQNISIPATFAIQYQQNWTWAVDPSPADPRDLQTDSHGDTIAAAWYSSTSFSFDLNLTDGNTHQISLYVMDWDSKGRAETISILDADGNPLDTRVIPSATGSSNTNTTGGNFVNGTYLIWNISGHVTISIKSNAGPNAVVSGVFFD